MEPLAQLSVYGDWALLLARFVLGAIFLMHGWSKVKGAKGFFFWLGLWETGWSLATLAGFLGHYAGAALALVMVGATYMKAFKWKVPFVGQDKAGYEFDLALFALGIALFAFGAGAWSVDAVMWR